MLGAWVVKTCGNALPVVSKFVDGVRHLVGVCGIKVIENVWLVRSQKGYCVKDKVAGVELGFAGVESGIAWVESGLAGVESGLAGVES